MKGLEGRSLAAEPADGTVSDARDQLLELGWGGGTSLRDRAACTADTAESASDEAAQECVAQCDGYPSSVVQWGLGASCSELAAALGN